MVLQAKMRVTADEFYALPEYAEHDFIELIDGEVVIGVAARTKHQLVAGEIFALCKLHARGHGGKAFFPPTEIYLDASNVFEPDVLYLTPDSRCEIQELRIIGAPELVVEVLSPSTAKYDRETKLKAYEAHGVLEYWIADPANEYIEVRVLRGGRFELVGTFVPGETFESSVMKGLTVTVAEVFAG